MRWLILLEQPSTLSLRCASEPLKPLWFTNPQGHFLQQRMLRVSQKHTVIWVQISLIQRCLSMKQTLGQTDLKDQKLQQPLLVSASPCWSRPGNVSASHSTLGHPPNHYFIGLSLETLSAK